MEEITLTRYRISDGRVFENKEEAAAIEQKLFEECVRDINGSGGLFKRLYQSHANCLFDYMIKQYNCPVIFEHLIGSSVLFYKSSYVWQLKTKEQANRAIEALSIHGIVPARTMQRIIDEGVMSKYLGRTMVLQISTTSYMSPINTDAYRIVDGIDKAFLKLHDDTAVIQTLLYSSQPQTQTEGDSEK